jgi:o-succinylbenzoate---CoA ligase
MKHRIKEGVHMNKETMPNFVKKRAFLTPDRVAVYFQEKSLTFKELFERAYDAAGQLQGYGLRRNQFVGVLLKNHLDTVVILFALQLIGVQAVILNNRLTSQELNWQLHDSQAKFLITEQDFSDVKFEIKKIVKQELFMSTIEEPIIVDEISLDDVCTVMYTSGTTGKPKGVIQTYGNHWGSAVGSALNLGITENDCWLCSVPLFHISGYSILMRSIIYGMPVVLHDNFDAQKTIADIAHKKITIMSVVGTMLSRVVESLNESRLPVHFRCMLLGGGPAPLPLLQACKQKEIPVFQTYGMTETASQIVTLSPEYSISKLGSAGKPLFLSQLQIRNEDGLAAEPGEAGEIVVKGPNVTKGYLNRPDATKGKFQNGWFSTGDIGYLDEEGFLFVLDRRSDLIISGGENIYPAEIESVILAHPDIEDVGITGIENDTWGQVPVAFVVKKPGAKVTAYDLQQHCLQHLAKYKVPKEYYFISELPRNAAKKLLRRKLRELLKEGKVLE